MSRELTAFEQAELLARIRVRLPDAEYSANQSYTGKATCFIDSCGCYSEWTTEACSLGVFIEGTLPETEDKQWKLRMGLEHLVKDWAVNNLAYSGCSCCGEETIYVNVSLFKKTVV